MLPDPGLRAHLDGVPGATGRWSVAEIKLTEIINAYVMKECDSKDIYTFRHFRVPVSNHLRPRQTATLPFPVTRMASFRVHG